VRVLLAALVVVVAACAPAAPAEDTARGDALVAAVNVAEPGSTVDLRSVVGSDWDRVVFLGPYTYNDRAKEALGFDFDIEAVSPWTNTEGGMLVVLASGSKVVAWFAVPSQQVGLHCLDQESIAAADTVLTVIEQQGGFRSLTDPDLPWC